MKGLSTTRFEFAHGKKPSKTAEGFWCFTDESTGLEHYTRGTLAQAFKEVKRLTGNNSFKLNS